ncbi:hypothetical protein L596_003054 [Steinernema carpocapsae]|uniref:WDR59/RTC1-like RING zinc finger domain-containing protein n=1 Tax=Steinernema carpocapsae TaxID=34508 RepID=A0A4U8UU71_STECR|nr:hypothetical protein L596_003054 [Steinernema carpocapsae]
MVVVRTDDGVSSWAKVNTTAVGVDVSGKFVAGAGDHFIFADAVDSILDLDRITRRKQTSLNNASLLKWHPQRTDMFAVVCSQVVSVYRFGPGGRMRAINTGRLHPKNINDLDWSYTNENVFMTCASGEPVAVWDYRCSLRRPIWELQAITGAEQASFAPSITNIISTAHGGDIRIWDDRYRSSPVASIIAHSGRITGLAWHPTKNTFVTSATDGYIKIWDFDSLPKPIHSFGVLSPPADKVRYSLDGEEFVTIPRPGAQSKAALTIWHSTSYASLQVLPSDSDPVTDVSWQHHDNKKFLFTMHESGTMQRFPLLSQEEISGNLDMAVPIEQSEADKEVDKMLAPTSDVPVVPEQEFDVSKEFERGKSQQALSPDNLPAPNFPGTWSCWIKAKSRYSNNLGSELEALRKLNTEGLITNEINFNRAACGFTFEHKTFEQRRIYIEIRFHAMFIKNSTILVKIHQKDCPLDEERANNLLKRFEEESDRLMLHENDQPVHPNDQKCVSVFGRVLQNMPSLINALQLPGTYIDIPLRKDRVDSCYSRSIPLSEASEDDSGDGELGPRGSSAMGYVMSPLDEYVPAPRTCGVRFNESGYLMMFGKVHYSKSLQSLFPKCDFAEVFDDDQSAVGGRKPKKPRSARANRTVSTSEKVVPKRLIRSLKDYEIATCNECYERPHERTSSEYSESTPMAAGVVGGNMWNVLRKDSVKQPVTLGSSPSRSMGMQNISLNYITHRNRGNSLTGPGVLADDHYRLLQSVPKHVIVYDAANLLPITKEFAGNYKVIGEDALELVNHNRKVARSSGRYDQVRAWNVIEQVVHGSIQEQHDEENMPRREPKVKVNGVYDYFMAGKFLENKVITYFPFPKPNRNVSGRRLINYIISMYVKAGDFQMASLICCVLHSRPGRIFVDKELPVNEEEKPSINVLRPYDFLPKGHIRSASSSSDTYGGVSGHNTIHSGVSFELRGCQQRLADVTHPPVTSLDITERGRSYESESLVANMKNQPKHSKNSILNAMTWDSKAGKKFKKMFRGQDAADQSHSSPGTKTDSETDEDTEEEIVGFEDIIQADVIEAPEPDNESQLLVDPELRERFEDIRNTYADLLFRWQLYVKSAEILKYNEPSENDCGLLKAFYKNRSCEEEHTQDEEWVEEPQIDVSCIICQSPCKGQIVTCLSCRHGGHVEHMTDWFKKQTWCPSGCGCVCLI